MKTILSFALSLLLAYLPCSLAAESVAEIDDNPNMHILLLPHMSVLEDFDAKLNVSQLNQDDVKQGFKALQDGESRFFRHAGTYWFRFQIKNIATKPQRLWLELDNIRLDNITLYSQESGESKVSYSGDHYVNPLWLVQERNHVMRLELNAGTTNSYYLKVQSSSGVLFAPRLFGDHSQTVHFGSLNIQLGVIYGILFALFIYSLNIYITLKDQTFLYFLGLLLAGAWQTAAVQGTVRLVFPDNTWLVDSATTVSSVAYIIMSTLFVRRFLLLPQHRPMLDLVFLTTALLSLICLPLYLWQVQTTENLVIGFGSVNSFLVCYAAIVRFRDGYSPSIFVIAASLIFFSPLLIMITLPETTLPGFSSENLFNFCQVLQLVALACGLASRIDRLNTQLTYEIAERRRREQHLIQAQSIARYGDWSWNIHTLEFRFSPNTLKILPELANYSTDNFGDVLKHILPGDRRALIRAHKRALKGIAGIQQEFRLNRDDDDLRHFLVQADFLEDDDGPNADLLVGTLHDITDQKRAELAQKEHEEELRNLGYYDSLTGLANRNLFQDKLQQAIDVAKSTPQAHALLFIDLDHFKNVNDSLGHDIGDQLLVAVGKRIAACVDPLDTVARLGGDEFAVVLNNIPGRGIAGKCANRIIDAMTDTIRVDDYKLQTTASIGIVLCPSDGEKIGELIRKADFAMYQAKREGRNNYQFYTDELNAQIKERIELESDLHRALERDEFQVHYQPKVDFANGAIVGAEALLRWTSEKRGSVPPGDFIKVAEDTGLIWAIGDYVLRDACTQAKLWCARYREFKSIAVNISGVQFNRADLVDTIKQVLEEIHTPPQMIELEITEGAIIDNATYVIDVMRQLKAIGIKLSLDDFGTGYSSLNYLKRFPVDCLKIDRSFVREIVYNTTDRKIAANIVNLAHDLNLTVVAEGVESAEQLSIIQDMGCDELQGFIYSKPLETKHMEALLLENSKVQDVVHRRSLINRIDEAKKKS